VYFGLPNFSLLNLKNFVLNDIVFSAMQLFAIAGGALLWIFVLLVLASAFFHIANFEVFSFVLLAAFLLALSGLGIYSAQSYTWPIIEGHFYEMEKNPGYIPTGERLRPFLMGFDHFTADLFWIRAAQYAGGNSGAFEFDSLPEYIDLVTDLDPHFGFAYRFGALVYPLNEVAIKKVDDLLIKGIELNRDTHPELLPQMYIDLAFYTYYYEDDLEKGAEIYEECAATIPDCPPFAEKVAAFLRSKAGKHEIALRIWIDRFLEKQEKGRSRFRT
jgi:hypothetical protein